jgi:acetate kinase
MKVLVLNCGSSSIKYKLYNMDDESVLAQGGVERIGLDNAFIKVKLPNGEKKQIMHDMPDHKEGVNFVFKCLLDPEIGLHTPRYRPNEPERWLHLPHCHHSCRTYGDLGITVDNQA